MTKLNLSVIICAHNPRRDYLEQVLQALKTQSLPQDLWELLLIDNASNVILASEVDLSWHSNAKHIREETLGLTPARLRGIREARAETLVFVDDDNILDSDYLKIALKISEDSPFLGAWGGQIKPQFEKTPPEWTKPYWYHLAIRELEQDQWSNIYHPLTTPHGAGFCVRKVVANHYAKSVQTHPKRAGMGRTGKLLLSCEDADIAYTACDIGLGTGVFVSLHVMHLIPPKRLEEDYLLRLVEGMCYSHVMLDSFRDRPLPNVKLSVPGRVREWYEFLKMSPRERRFHKVRKRGQALAIAELQHSEARDSDQLQFSKHCS